MIEFGIELNFKNVKGVQSSDKLVLIQMKIIRKKNLKNLSF